MYISKLVLNKRRLKSKVQGITPNKKILGKLDFIFFLFIKSNLPISIIPSKTKNISSGIDTIIIFITTSNKVKISPQISA